ncbi:MAG: L-aspartate oxidase [Bryobacteraceae bacterium]|nr:L-aspartate oxidase [Bryobacteraceae bacterium]
MDTDFLVVGAGVAGLRAAIELAPAGRVLVVAKDTLEESSSQYAQGGIAVALSDDDDIELHEQDTLAAGDGLCNPDAVRTLVEEGPAAIQELIDWGAAFDREAGRLVFAREGAHSRSRVLHAHGDSTGQEIARTLYFRASANRNIEFRSFSSITDLLMADGHCAGAIAFDERTNTRIPIRARAVLLATGGLGRVYLNTTNPQVATGDGVALAWSAGAEISDIEFVQFHPTALHVENAPRFLLSEALRGEGARLINIKGQAFMAKYHDLEELAPRDVVSRAIVAEMERTRQPHVFLDLTHLDAAFLRRRFPRIYETCLTYGIDLAAQPAPVHPAAHYAMGGVRTGLDAKTSVPRLYAAGEVACTGVHGANRLASNSLLEGVVFGARAGRAMLDWSSAPHLTALPPGPPRFPATTELGLRTIAWNYCGIARTAQGLTEALARLDKPEQPPATHPTRAAFELRNMHTVATLIARAALAREESRGGHYRLDHPTRRPEFQKHSVLLGHAGVRFSD